MLGCLWTEVYSFSSHIIPVFSLCHKETPTELLNTHLHKPSLLFFLQLPHTSPFVSDVLPPLLVAIPVLVFVSLPHFLLWFFVSVTPLFSASLYLHSTVPHVLIQAVYVLWLHYITFSFSVDIRLQCIRASLHFHCFYYGQTHWQRLMEVVQERKCSTLMCWFVYTLTNLFVYTLTNLFLLLLVWSCRVLSGAKCEIKWS